VKAVKIIRLDGALNYLSVDCFMSAIGRWAGLNGVIDRREVLECDVEQSLVDHETLPSRPHTIIVDCSVMAYVDSMGLSALVEVGLLLVQLLW
jgi:ABC-type transporter Mla MlaB component